MFKYEDYELSEASRITLTFQGGPMSADEAAVFESNPLFESVLRMRTYDELAKEAGVGDVATSVIGELVEDHVYRNLKKKKKKKNEESIVSASASASGGDAPKYVLSFEQRRFAAEHGYLLIRGYAATTQVDSGPLARFFALAPRELASLPVDVAELDFPWQVQCGNSSASCCVPRAAKDLVSCAQ